MMALLSPKFIIALVLAGVLAVSHFTAYRSGKASKQAEWDQDKAAQVAAALAQSEANRMRERALDHTNEGVNHAYLKEKQRLAAAAGVARKRVSELESALARVAGTTATTGPGTDDPRSAIIGECASALRELDEYAQGVAGKARALQGYTAGVCLGKP